MSWQVRKKYITMEQAGPAYREGRVGLLLYSGHTITLLFPFVFFLSISLFTLPLLTSSLFPHLCHYLLVRLTKKGIEYNNRSIQIERMTTGVADPRSSSDV